MSNRGERYLDNPQGSSDSCAGNRQNLISNLTKKINEISKEMSEASRMFWEDWEANAPKGTGLCEEPRYARVVAEASGVGPDLSEFQDQITSLRELIDSARTMDCEQVFKLEAQYDDGKNQDQDSDYNPGFFAEYQKQYQEFKNWIANPLGSIMPFLSSGFEDLIDPINISIDPISMEPSGTGAGGVFNQDVTDSFMEARTLFKTAKLDSAETAYRNLINNHQNQPQAYFDLAVLMEGKKGDPAEILQLYQKFISMAENTPELANYVQIARRRIEEIRGTGSGEKPIETNRLPTQSPVSATVAQPVGSAPNRFEKRPPDVSDGGPKILCSVVLVSKEQALNSVKRGLEGSIIKKETVNDHIPMIYIPLWRVTCKFQKGPFGLIKKNINVYFHALNGKIMVVDKRGMHFTEYVEMHASQVSDLDDKAVFSNVPPSEISAQIRNPTLSKQEILQKTRHMFEIEVLYADLVYLPIWEFEIRNKKSGTIRKVYIDSTFGKYVT